MEFKTSILENMVITEKTTICTQFKIFACNSSVNYENPDFWI